MPLRDPVTMSPSAPEAKSKKDGSAAALVAPAATATSSSSSVGVGSSHDAASGPLGYVAASIPALQIQIFAVFFSQLVQDPVATMGRSMLPIMVIIQVAYAVLFLPVAGSSRSQRKTRPGEKKKAGPAGSEPNIIMAALLSLLLTLIATPPLHATMVLFGAPFLTHVPHTFLCAAHLSILALFPLFYTRDVDAAAWRALVGLRAPFDESVGALAGAFLGAWLGAVPIPLDWDRDWQRWPVTVLAGVYAGYTIGSYAGRTVLKGRRF
ncbi:hypothetical protein RB600_000722 [Gaeumannomyces tritici]